MVKVSRCIRRFVTDKYMRFQYLNKIGLYRVLPDKVWIEKWYSLKSDGQKIDLKTPVSLNEKMQWYKINYRNPVMTKLVDKVEVRNYVIEKGLENILPKQYGVYDRFEEIDFSELPDTFYLKTNNGSGSNRLVHKSELLNRTVKNKMKKCFNSKLKANYYWVFREWAYKNVKPKLICEEYLEPKDKKELVDFNLFCFWGEVKLIYYNVELADEKGRHSSTGKRAVFDRDMNYIREARTQMDKLPEEQCHIPDHMDEVIRDAEILASGIPYVRVDFMYVNQNIYFGELTFYSAGGYMELEPEELREKLSGYFDVDRIRKETNAV